jgi:hypothetical protein
VFAGADAGNAGSEGATGARRPTLAAGGLNAAQRRRMRARTLFGGNSMMTLVVGASPVSRASGGRAPSSSLAGAASQLGSVVHGGASSQPSSRPVSESRLRGTAEVPRRHPVAPAAAAQVALARTHVVGSTRCAQPPLGSSTAASDGLTLAWDGTEASAAAPEDRDRPLHAADMVRMILQRSSTGWAQTLQQPDRAVAVEPAIGASGPPVAARERQDSRGTEFSTRSGGSRSMPLSNPGRDSTVENPLEGGSNDRTVSAAPPTAAPCGGMSAGSAQELAEASAQPKPSSGVASTTDTSDQGSHLRRRTRSHHYLSDDEAATVRTAGVDVAVAAASPLLSTRAAATAVSEDLLDSAARARLNSRSQSPRKTGLPLLRAVPSRASMATASTSQSAPSPLPPGTAGGQCEARASRCSSESSAPPAELTSCNAGNGATHLAGVSGSALSPLPPARATVAAAPSPVPSAIRSVSGSSASSTPVSASSRVTAHQTMPAVTTLMPSSLRTESPAAPATGLAAAGTGPSPAPPRPTVTVDEYVDVIVGRVRLELYYWPRPTVVLTPDRYVRRQARRAAKRALQLQATPAEGEARSGGSQALTSSAVDDGVQVPSMSETCPESFSGASTAAVAVGRGLEAAAPAADTC